MRESDRPFCPDDIRAALALLSRVPLRVSPHAMARGARSAWCWPVVGLILASFATLLAVFLQAIGIKQEISALLALALLVVMTGALHEDGLADVADGFWGGFDRARRLDIMKDSHIGSYGVLALILSLGLRGAALIALADHLAVALLASAALSRAAMAHVMHKLPNARTTGLSAQTGRPPRQAVRIALLIAVGVVVLLTGWGAVWILLAAIAATYACARIAQAKIAGQTGDVLGATQQITEISTLLALSALL